MLSLLDTCTLALSYYCILAYMLNYHRKKGCWAMTGDANLRCSELIPLKSNLLNLRKAKASASETITLLSWDWVICDWTKKYKLQLWCPAYVAASNKRLQSRSSLATDRLVIVMPDYEHVYSILYTWGILTSQTSRKEVWLARLHVRFGHKWHST